MRKLMSLSLVVAIGLAAGTVTGQGRGGGGFGGPLLLMNPGVQQELKLTDEQKEKAGALTEKLGEKMRDAFQDAQGDFQKMGAEMQKINTAGMKDAAAFLKEDQVKRLKQISWQQGGVNTLARDEDLHKELKVTAEQKEKLVKLTDEMREKQMEIFQGGGGPEAFEKMQTLRKEFGEKGTNVLTADQQKSYKELLGKPFTVVFGPGGRRGPAKDKDK